jgi:hypothetical protein
MEIRIRFINDNNVNGIENFEDEVMLQRDDTITFTEDDIVVYHQSEEYIIHNLSLKKGNLLKVEIKV